MSEKYREQYQDIGGQWIMIDYRNPGIIIKRRAKMWKGVRFTNEQVGRTMREIAALVEPTEQPERSPS